MSNFYGTKHLPNVLKAKGISVLRLLYKQIYDPLARHSSQKGRHSAPLDIFGRTESGKKSAAKWTEEAYWLDSIWLARTRTPPGYFYTAQHGRHAFDTSLTIDVHRAQCEFARPSSMY